MRSTGTEWPAELPAAGPATPADRFAAGELDYLAADLGPRERLSLADWAVKYLRIIDGPVVGAAGSAAWTPAGFPLQVGPQAAMSDNRWARITVVTCPQAFGKTTSVALPPLLRAIHEGRQAIYVGANANLANTTWFTKILPTIETIPELAALLHADRNEAGDRLARYFTNGAVLHVVGAESAGNLSSKTCPVVVCDDVQAYPPSLPRFGHPADYALTRAAAFPVEQTTCCLIGTPGSADDFLWRSLAGSAFYVPLIPCPRCGTLQLLEWERMRYDPSDPEAARADCRMGCARPDCGRTIGFEELPALLIGHAWASMPPGADWIVEPPAGGVRLAEPEPRIRARKRRNAETEQRWMDGSPAHLYPATGRNTNQAGFWASALYWPWGMSWGDRAADWIGRTGSPDRVKDFQQHVLARGHRPPADQDDETESLTPADIRAHAADSHKWATVPGDAGAHATGGVLVGSVDVMGGYIWYLVMAWKLASGTSWLVEAGRFGRRSKDQGFGSQAERAAFWRRSTSHSLDDLWAKDSAGWPVLGPGGEELATVRPALWLVDCRFMRDMVHAFCHARNGSGPRRWVPAEGSTAPAHSKTPIWSPTLQKERRTKRLYREINVNQAKLVLRELLAVPLTEPGCHVIAADTPDFIRETYAKHLAAESFEARTGRWREISRHNHLLDCAAINLAGAIGSGVTLRGHAGAMPQVTEVRDWFASQKRKNET